MSESISKNSPEEIALVGVSEIALLLDVSKQTVSNWRARDDSFPRPMADLKSGPVWLRSEIVVWAQAHGHRIQKSEISKGLASARKKARVVAVMNAKGGVGKSTVAINLGWYCFSKFHKRVLLVDLDPQFNLSQYALGSDAYESLVLEGKPTISNIFSANGTSEIGKKAIYPIRVSRIGGKLDLIPSSLDLAWVTRDGYFKHELLDNYLRHIVGKENYDLILIDCPPTDSVLTDAAYSASDFLLIPVRPEFLPAIGLPLIDRSLQRFRTLKPDSNVEIAGVLLNGVVESKPEYTRSKADIVKAAKLFNWPIFKSEMSSSESYPKGSRLGLPIFLTGHARWEKISEFISFAREFAERISL